MVRAREVRAYNAQMNHSTWDKMSDRYKKIVNDAKDKYEIQELCDILLYEFISSLH